MHVRHSRDCTSSYYHHQKKILYYPVEQFAIKSGFVLVFIEWSRWKLFFWTINFEDYNSTDSSGNKKKRKRNQPPFVDKQFRTEIYKSKLRKKQCKNPAKQNEIL